MKPDPSADVAALDPPPLYIHFLPDYHGECITTEVRDGLLFDTTPDNRLIGVEVLDYDRLDIDGKPAATAADRRLAELRAGRRGK